MPHLGQHFLTDLTYLDKIVDAADIAVGDEILEIGPGRGHLTRRLLDHGAKVTAIELDRGLANEVERTIDDDNFTLVRGDAAEIDWPEAHKLVANLPYQISSPVVERFTASNLEVAVLTVQQAFADRLTADPAEEETSHLTIQTRLTTDAESLFAVPRGSFEPPPDVDNACVRLTPHEPPDVNDRELLDEILHHTFTQKRKMLRSSLKEYDQARAALDDLDLSTRRPGRLTVDEWVELANRIQELRST
jgi:16S rRNA (adenine1518-N6/adenine1519-N6)-dimethyltransferase